MKELVNEVLLNRGLEPKLVDEIVLVGRLKKAHANGVVIAPEIPSDEMPLVLKGLLKVVRQDPDGHEVFLYFLEGGETCAMSITCCIDGKRSSIKVVAEEEATMWMVPMGYLDSWIVKYPSFRSFVFNAYQTRFDELLMTIDSVVFSNLDQRLYKYLLDAKQATGSFEIRKTHEQIARELSTSRVVVSRLLKKLENEEKIEQHRNRIEIL
jgi:CRP/FNR family transcriptional regulator